MFDADLDEVLRKTALFAQLTAEEREEIEAIGRVVRARAGSTLIRQGDEAGGMSVVVSGRVRIELELPDGRRETLATLSRGDVFGELSLVDRFPRSASAVADTDARVFLINGTEFDRLRAAFRPATYKILRAVGPILCKRLRAVDRAIAERLLDRRQTRIGGSAPDDGAAQTDGFRARPHRLNFDDLPLMGTPVPPPLPAGEAPGPVTAEQLLEEIEEVIELSDSNLAEEEA